MWLGSNVCVSFLVAPVAHGNFPTAEARRFLRPLFPRYYRLGALCGFVALGMVLLGRASLTQEELMRLSLPVTSPVERPSRSFVGTNTGTGHDSVPLPCPSRYRVRPPGALQYQSGNDKTPSQQAFILVDLGVLNSCPKEDLNLHVHTDTST